MPKIFYCDKCNNIVNREGFYFDFVDYAENKCPNCNIKCKIFEIDHSRTFYFGFFLIVFFSIFFSIYLLLIAYLSGFSSNKYLLYLILWIIIDISIIIGFGIVLETIEFNSIQKMININFKKIILKKLTLISREIDKNEKINWIKNDFKYSIRKVMILFLILGILTLVTEIYFLLLLFQFKIHIIYPIIINLITFYLFCISIAAFLTYRRTPTYVGFSNNGLYIKNKLQKNRLLNVYNKFIPLDYIGWNDIEKIIHVISYPGFRLTAKGHYNIDEKKFKSPFRSSLLVYSKQGLIFELFNLGIPIMEEIINKHKMIT